MKTIPLISLFLVALFLHSGCAFQRVKKEQKEMASTLADLKGKVISDTASKKAIIIAIFDSSPAQSKLYNYFITRILI